METPTEGNSDVARIKTIPPSQTPPKNKVSPSDQDPATNALTIVKNTNFPSERNYNKRYWLKEKQHHINVSYPYEQVPDIELSQTYRKANLLGIQWDSSREGYDQICNACGEYVNKDRIAVCSHKNRAS